MIGLSIPVAHSVTSQPPPAAGRHPEDLAAHQIRVEVVVVVGDGPDALGHECATGDRVAAAGLVAVGVDRIRHPGRRRATVRRGARRAEPLPHVPAVVRAGLAQVDLLPGDLPDVVDEEAGRGRVGVDREPERIAQAPGEGLLAARPGVVRPVTLQRAVPAPCQGLPAGIAPVAGDAQDLRRAARAGRGRRRSARRQPLSPA